MRSLRLVWLTDIHLNFLGKKELAWFWKSVGEKHPDAVLISGDIANGTTVEEHLDRIEQAFGVPILFVLGNHDFYGASIEEVRDRMVKLTERSSWLRWLPAVGVVSVAPDVAVIGHDGWGDGRMGDYARSEVLMNDFVLIREFQHEDKPGRLLRMRALGAEAAAYLDRVLAQALATHGRVILLTHVPPFEKTARYEGRVCMPDYLPFFGCGAVGEVLAARMAAVPEKRLLVLCGHTHDLADLEVLPNLRVLVGRATYGAPVVQRVFTTDWLGPWPEGDAP